MALARWFKRRMEASQLFKAERRLRSAIAPTIEGLEERRLFTTYTYYVPTGTTEITLKPDVSSGNVYVYLGTNTYSSHEFTDASGTDIIAASGSGVLCKDKVPAADKPTGGIEFTSGSSSTLEIDAGPTDTEVDVVDPTSSSATIESIDSSGSPAVVGVDSFGAGVNSLTIVTNDTGSAVVNVPDLASGINLTVKCGSGQGNTISLGDGGEGDAVNGAVVTATAGDNTVNLITDGDESGSASVDLGATSGNTLTVAGDCTATLADHIGDGHTVTVDTVILEGGSGSPDYGGTLLVTSKSALGTVTIGNVATMVVEASGTTVDSLTVDGTAEIEASTTITTLSDSGTGYGTTEFTGASGSSTVGSVDDSGYFLADYGSDVVVGSVGGSTDSTFSTVEVAGDLTLHVPSTITTLDQSNGKTLLDQSGVWSTNTIDTIDITGGQLDIGAQDVVTTTDPSIVRAYLESAYNSPSDDWSGSGISSFYAAENPNYDAIGYASAADASEYPSNTSLSGLGLTSSQVLIRPTLAGDADLSGTVDAVDFNLMSNDYLTSNQDWVGGDFNYDTYVDFSDFSLLANTYLQTFSI